MFDELSLDDAFARCISPNRISYHFSFVDFAVAPSLLSLSSLAKVAVVIETTATYLVLLVEILSSRCNDCHQLPFVFVFLPPPTLALASVMTCRSHHSRAQHHPPASKPFTLLLHNHGLSHRFCRRLPSISSFFSVLPTLRNDRSSRAIIACTPRGPDGRK